MKLWIKLLWFAGSYCVILGLYELHIVNVKAAVGFTALALWYAVDELHYRFTKQRLELEEWKTRTEVEFYKIRQGLRAMRRRSHVPEDVVIDLAEATRCRLPPSSATRAGRTRKS